MSLFEDELKQIARCDSFDSIRPIALADLQIETVLRGIVVVVATWSGAAKLAFSTLTVAINDYLRGGLTLFVVDHDRENPDFINQTLGVRPEGWGETIWIKNGTIIHRAARLTINDREMIREQTSKLV